MKEELVYNKKLKSTWPPNISSDVIQHCTNNYMQGTKLQQPHACCCCSQKLFHVDMAIVKLSENCDTCQDLHLDLLVATKEEFYIYFQYPVESLAGACLIPIVSLLTILGILKVSYFAISVLMISKRISFQRF